MSLTTNEGAASLGARTGERGSDRLRAIAVESERAASDLLALGVLDERDTAFVSHMQGRARLYDRCADAAERCGS